MAVLGPSGCGKTTLLRIIAGFMAADAGSVELGSRPVLVDGRSRVPTRERNIGYVPQEGALFPHLDVAANITFGLTRSERREADIGGLLDLLGLDPSLAGRAPHELSGGQQHRSDERRVGKECVSTCRSRWSPSHSKNTHTKTQKYQKTISISRRSK